MNALTLRNRLRISILGLVVTVVLALSVLNLQSSVQETFADAEERARLVAEQIAGYLSGKIQAAGNPPIDSLASEATAAGDPVLTQMLHRSSVYSGFVSEILVTDTRNRVLAASNQNRAGQFAASRPSFSGIRQRQTWISLFHLLSSGEDYTIESAAGSRLWVQVVISSALLRTVLVPKLRQLLIVALVSLLLSGLLAIVISDLVGGSLERIGRDIENISTGESKEPAEPFESAELASLQVKLSLLGKQYRGAREDADILRHNIDQMIQRLEEAVLLFDEEGCLQTAGPPAERLLAKSREELVGKTLDEVFPVWTQTGAAIQSAVRLRTSVFNRAVSYARNNLPDTKLLVSVEAVNSSANKPLGTLVTLRDAEVRRQLESNIDMSDRIAAIHRLTSGVAHEIKNPLNAITLHLELARAKVREDQPLLVSELEVVSKDLLRLDRVVKTFLNFSRPMDLRMTECNLTEIVGEALVQAGMLKGSHGIKFVFDSTVPNPVVLADRVLSKQAILNVLTNALEAMPNGGEVQVGIEKRFDDYVVNISDSGAGIQPEISERIYNLYFTTKPDGKGVGLAEAFMVMQLHNGSIDFDCQPGKGSTFRLRFPGKSLEPA